MPDIDKTVSERKVEPMLRKVGRPSPTGGPLMTNFCNDAVLNSFISRIGFFRTGHSKSIYKDIMLHLHCDNTSVAKAKVDSSVKLPRYMSDTLNSVLVVVFERA